MFNGLPLPNFEDLAPYAEPQQPIDGHVFICRQSALHFGQDKEKPARTRSVVTVRTYGRMVHVAPATGLNSRDVRRVGFLDSRDTRNVGFELTSERVIWSKGRPEPLWAMDPVEAIYKDQFVMPQGWLTPRGKQEFRSWISNTVLPRARAK